VEGYLLVGIARRALGDALIGWVDPGRVPRHAVRDFTRRQASLGRSARFVCPGDWDLTPLGFCGDFRHRGTRELLAAELRYRETPTYHQMLRDLAAGSPPRWHVPLSTPEAVDAYWESRVALTRSMLDQGFVWTDDSEHLGVAVGRDGGLVKTSNGNHRFALARALGLPGVPVRIDAVHTSWLHAQLRHGGPPRRVLADGLRGLLS
jgi:hypothetical protein